MAKNEVRLIHWIGNNVHRFGERGIEGKIAAVGYARINEIPCLGLCLGMQVMTIEYARNVLGLSGAHSTEFNPSTPHPVIDLMESQKKIITIFRNLPSTNFNLFCEMP